jgi:hypothetical protein
MADLAKVKPAVEEAQQGLNINSSPLKHLRISLTLFIYFMNRSLIFRTYPMIILFYFDLFFVFQPFNQLKNRI